MNVSFGWSSERNVSGGLRTLVLSDADPKHGWILGVAFRGAMIEVENQVT